MVSSLFFVFCSCLFSFLFSSFLVALSCTISSCVLVCYLPLSGSSPSHFRVGRKDTGGSALDSPSWGSNNPRPHRSRKPTGGADRSMGHDPAISSTTREPKTAGDADHSIGREPTTTINRTRAKNPRAAPTARWDMNQQPASTRGQENRGRRRPLDRT